MMDAILLLRRHVTPFAVMLLAMSISGCLGGEEPNDSPRPFSSFEGCRLELPDGEPVDCAGTAAPFVDPEMVPAWNCVWHFQGGGYDGWVVGSPDGRYGAVHLRGPQPQQNATLAVALEMDGQPSKLFAGPWTEAEQYFVFPRTVNTEGGQLFVAGSAVRNATVDEAPVDVETRWAGIVSGVPSPITKVEIDGRAYDFHSFHNFTTGSLSVPMPSYTFSIEQNATFQVTRAVPIQVGTGVAGTIWSGTCIDGEDGGAAPSSSVWSNIPVRS